MKTRTRILSLILISALLLQILPAGVFAADDNPVSSESPVNEYDSEPIEIPDEDSDPIDTSDESELSEEVDTYEEPESAQEDIESSTEEEVDIESEETIDEKSEPTEYFNDELITSDSEHISAYEKIIGEDSGKREESVKHFICSDGTYKAVSYGNRVHWKQSEDAEWIPINNKLILTENEENAFYAPESSPVDVKLAYSASENNLVDYSIADHSISWYYEGMADNVTPSLIHDNYNYSSKEEEIVIPKDLSGKLVYENLFDHTDVQYTVLPQGVKEDIILNSKEAPSSFVAVYYIGDLDVIEEDGVILLEDNGEEIARIAAPMLEDASGAFCNGAIIKILSNEAGILKVQISADEEWIHSEERVFPVKIDPYIFEKVETNANDGSALYTWSSYPYGTLVVGKDSTYGRARTYIKFTLPTLSSGDMVTGGTVAVAQYQTSYGYYASDGKPMNIEVHRVTTSWTETQLRNSISFNNLPYISGQISEYGQTSSVSAKTFRYFDVSEITKGWYNGNYDNYGIQLRSSDESRTAQTSFVSHNNSSYPSCCPQLVISYLNNKGLEGYWTYHQQSAGISGTGYVNDYTGNLVFVAPIMADTGNMVPLSVNAVYNGYQAGSEFGTMKAGYGWRLDFTQCIQAITNSSTDTLEKALYTAGFRYRYIDGDGTEHYLKSKSGKYVDEEGLGLSLTVYSSVNSASEKYMLEFESGEKISFTNVGRIRRIYNTDGKYLRFYYTNITSGYIDEVYDGTSTTAAGASTSGRRTGFAFDSSSMRLTSVTDSAGRTTTLTYNNGDLTRITYPDGTQTLFTYSSHKLTSVRGVDGCTIVYSYPSSGNAAEKSRVTGIAIYDNTGTISEAHKGGSLSIAYTYNNYTTFTDNRSRTETYQFDNSGRTICITDAYGGAAKYGYTDSSVVNGKSNKLTGMSAVTHHIDNLLKNSSFESSSNWSLNTGASISSENPRIGSKSLKLTQGASGSAVHGAQTFVLPAGTYTLSAYVKIDSPTAYARLQVGFFVGGSYSSIASPQRKVVGDYTRIAFTFTVPEGCERGEVILKMNGTGTIWYDCVQLERGTSANDYNLLENSSFTDTASTVWKGVNFDTSTDAYQTSSGEQGNYYKIIGAIGVQKRLYQMVYINKPAKDVAFSVSGKVKAASVPLIDNRSCALHITTYFADGTNVVDTFPFNPDVNIWQFNTGVVAYKDANLSKTVNSIAVSVIYGYNANTVDIDDMMFTIDCTGTTYVYDDNGTLLSAKDNAGRHQTFTYSSAKELQHVDTEDNQEYDFTYDSSYSHRLRSAKSNGSGVRFAFEYDNATGNSIRTLISNDSVNENESRSRMLTQSTYSNGGNYLATSTDALGYATNYTYDLLRGTLTRVENAYHTITAYSYDPNNDRLLSTSSSGSQVSYSYNNKGYLSGIESSTSDYTLTYDNFGNTATVDVGTNRLVTNVYDAVSGNLTQSTYGNGVVLSYEYDEFDRVVSVSQDGVPIASYTYNAMSQLASYTDETSGVTYVYTYDLIGRLLRTEGSDGTSFESTYDNVDKTTGVKYTYDGVAKEVTYTYDGEKDNLPQTTTWGSGSSAPYRTYSYDKLERVASVTTNTGSVSIERNYSYINSYIADVYTTALVDTITCNLSDDIPNLGTYYNRLGNIVNLRHGDNYVEHYTYDTKSQLTRVDSLLTNKTTVYAYDNGGNITSVKEYAYTTGSLDGLTPTDTKLYTYGNANWPDLLTAYDGTPITYDAIGNPTSYRGASMTWSGRRLSSYSKSGVSASYVYDESGIRTQKTVDGTTTDYFLSGSTILAEKTGSNITWYLYDSLGNPVGYEWNGAKYWYITNLQGDILYVVNSAGTPIGSYTYSPYGDFTASVLSSSDSTAFSANHLTYRGYYYDAEMGLYYLNARYYDPQVGRFISADSAISGSGKSVQGYNLFTYCLNNPVNMDDPTGNWPKWLEKVAKTVAIVAVVVTAAVVVAVATAGTGGLALAAAGVAFGTACGGLVGGIANGKEGRSFIKGWVGGAVNGFTQSVGTVAFGPAGTIAGGGVGSGLGTAVTESLNNRGKSKEQQKSSKEILSNSLKSAAIGTVMSTMTAGIGYGIDYARSPWGYNSWAGSLRSGVGIAPITPGFGEMMKGFFSSIDDALVYLFCE